MMMQYQKLYATLVGRVENAILYLERITGEQSFDWFHVTQVTEMLKAALLEAEEQYIEAAEESDHRLIILPHSTAGQAEDSR